MLKQFKQLKLSKPKQKTTKKQQSFNSFNIFRHFQLSVAGVHRWLFGTLLAEKTKVPHMKPERTRLNSFSSDGLLARLLAGEWERNSDVNICSLHQSGLKCSWLPSETQRKNLHVHFPSATTPQRPAVLWCSHMLLHLRTQLHWWGIPYNSCNHMWRQTFWQPFQHTIIKISSLGAKHISEMKLERAWSMLNHCPWMYHTIHTAIYDVSVSSRPSRFSDSSHCHCHSHHRYNHCLSRCHRTSLPHIHPLLWLPSLHSTLVFDCQIENEKTINVGKAVCLLLKKIFGWTIFVTVAESNLLILCWSRACQVMDKTPWSKHTLHSLEETPVRFTRSLPGRFLAIWGSRCQRRVSRQDAKSARKMKQVQKPDVQMQTKTCIILYSTN